MLFLSIVAFVLNAAVVVRGSLFLATANSRRAVDRSIVTAIIAVSLLHMVARVVVWASAGTASSSIAPTLFTAYAIAVAALFLALVNCYINGANARRKRRRPDA